MQIGNGVIAVNSERRLRSLVRAQFAPESPCATQSGKVQIILLIAGCSKVDFRIGSRSDDISWSANRYSWGIDMWIVFRACRWLMFSSVGSCKGRISVVVVMLCRNWGTVGGDATVA